MRPRSSASAGLCSSYFRCSWSPHWALLQLSSWQLISPTSTFLSLVLALALHFDDDQPPQLDGVRWPRTPSARRRVPRPCAIRRVPPSAPLFLSSPASSPSHRDALFPAPPPAGGGRDPTEEGLPRSHHTRPELDEWTTAS
ncbi:hypothetical protein VPH35_065465 [Triticum aestivum]